MSVLLGNLLMLVMDVGSYLIMARRRQLVVIPLKIHTCLHYTRGSGEMDLSLVDRDGGLVPLFRV